jgi:hypothetical protein
MALTMPVSQLGLQNFNGATTSLTCHLLVGAGDLKARFIETAILYRSMLQGLH